MPSATLARLGDAAKDKGKWMALGKTQVFRALAIDLMLTRGVIATPLSSDTSLSLTRMRIITSLVQSVLSFLVGTISCASAANAGTGVSTNIVRIVETAVLLL